MKAFNLLKNSILYLFAKRTVGVRALVIRNDHVLLVKHTYHPQWYTVGGAVEVGETPLQAIVRELKEEVGAILSVPVKLTSVFYSKQAKHDDYIIFYLVNACENCIFEDVNSPEILEKKWFPLDQLPPDISPATQRRIDEYLGKIAISEEW